MYIYTDPIPLIPGSRLGSRCDPSGLAPCTRPVFLWKNGREMEDKSKRTDKYEKNVTKIVFSDFSPSFLRFNGHSAAAHCIHQGQTPSNNRTQSLRVTAKASRGPRAAGRARSATPLSEPGGGDSPRRRGHQGALAPPAAPALDALSAIRAVQWQWEHRDDEFTCNHMPTCDPRT